MKRMPITLILTTAGCSTASSDLTHDEPAYAIRDSAGIEIVESHRSIWPQGEGWMLSMEPILQIGVGDGEDAYVFDRVTDVVRFDDGTLVVANSGDNTLRYYDDTGSFLHSSAGRGGGPAEFTERISGLGRLGDSVIAWPFAVQPSKLFDRQGNLVRALGAPPRPSEIRGVFSDGSHLYVSRIGSPSTDPNLYLDSGYVYLAAPGFSHIDSVGRLPMRYIAQQFQPRVFGATRALAVGDDEWYYGWPETYELHVLNQTPSVRRVLRRAWQPVPVTDAHIERYRESVLAPPGGQPRRRLDPSRLDAHPYPNFHSAFQRIEIDPQQHVWVELTVPGWHKDEFVLPAFSDDPVIWDVFDPSGVWLGSVTMPPRFLVCEIGNDYVAGVWKDALDVERVRVFGIIKP